MASLPGLEPAHLSTLGVTGRPCFNREQPAELRPSDSLPDFSNKKLPGGILNNAQRWPDRVSAKDGGE